MPFGWHVPRRMTHSCTTHPMHASSVQEMESVGPPPDEVPPNLDTKAPQLKIRHLAGGGAFAYV